MAAYLLNPARTNYRLEEVAAELLGEGPGRPPGSRARSVWELWAMAPRALEEVGLRALYEDVEKPLIAVLAAMERHGIRVDPARLGEFSRELEQALERTTREIYALAGEEFNIGSPKQLAAVLFEKLKLPPLRKTKTGYSTDADVLEQLALGHELPAKIIEHRTLAKLKSTYADALPTLINPRTGRIHTSFNQMVAVTGRLSCLPAGAMVDTGRGMIGIEEVQPGDFVRTARGPRRVLAAEMTAVKPVVALHLSSGITFRGSPDHKVRSRGEWKEMSALEVGDPIYMSFREGLFGSMVALRYKLTAAYKTRKTPALPTEWSVAFAELMGYAMADGHIARSNYNDKPAKLVLAFGWNDDELIKHFADIILQLFGKSATRRLTRTCPVLDVSGVDICGLIRATGGWRPFRRDPSAAELVDGPREHCRGLLARVLRGRRHCVALPVCPIGVQGHAGGCSSSPDAVRGSITHTRRVGRPPGLCSPTHAARPRRPMQRTRSRAELGSSPAARRISSKPCSRDSRSRACPSSSRSRLPAMCSDSKARCTPRTVTRQARFLKATTSLCTGLIRDARRARSRGPSGFFESIGPDVSDEPSFLVEAVAGQYYEVFVESLTYEPPVPMFDIAVDGGEYIADGIVVHNSSQPNVQNIPIRTELGRRIRAAFIPEPGWSFLSADYSQIELRILAHVSGEESLVEAFRRGEDIHRRTAAEVFGGDPAAVTPAQRDVAKTTNFSVIYGVTAFGLSRGLAMTQKQAQVYLDQFFARHPKVKAYLERTVTEGRARGYVTTLLGRRRYLPELSSGNPNLRGFGERMATNAPIQGTAADLIKVAMVRVARELGARGLRSRMLLQVHDELLFEAPPEELARLEALAVEVMESALTLDVPLKVDVKAGPDWAAV